MVSIHDLFNAVKAHPDFVFGTIFVKDDFPDGEALWGEHGDAKWATEHIVAAGNEYIENEAVKRPYVTQTGRVLDDTDIQALADEAERGYEIKGGTDAA